MKKWMMTAVALMMSAAMLAGCGNNAGADNTESAAVESADNNNAADNSGLTMQVYGEEAYVNGVNVANLVTLGEYKGLAASAPAPTVEDAYLEGYIDYIRQSNMISTEITDRAVQEGDTTNIDYEGKKDGVAFEGGTAQGQTLVIGSNSFIDGFEDGLIGVEIGETVDLNLTFPENYHSAELAGQEVVFTVTVNGIRVEEMPELTDEFVQGLGMGVNTVEEFRQMSYDLLMEQEVANYNAQLLTQLMEQVLNNSVISENIPAEMLERYTERITDNLAYSASMYGMDVETFMAMSGTTEELLQESAKNTAQQILLMKAIADAEGLNPTEEDISAELVVSAEAYGYDNVEEYKALIDMPAFEEYVLTEKVTAFLIENGVITETAAE